jgi:hypothetical protein
MQNRKSCFAYFYVLDLPELKLIWNFSDVNILPQEAPEGEEVNKTRPRGQTSRWCGALAQAEPP